MTFVVKERTSSRKTGLTRDGRTDTLEFVGVGSSDDAEARAGFEADIPTSFLGQFLDNIDIEPVGGEVWYATAKYSASAFQSEGGQGGETSPPPPPPPPSTTDPIGPEFSFDISVVTEKITQSKETVAENAIGGAIFAPRTKQVIGITPDGEILGCEKYRPHMAWSITKTYDFVTLGYIQTIFNQVATVNSGTFYSFPGGTTLFMGVSLQIKDKVSATFKFESSPNLTGITISDEIDPVDKKGWEFLWVMYENVEDTDASRLTMHPFAIKVERIYDSSDFSTIGIGG